VPLRLLCVVQSPRLESACFESECGSPHCTLAQIYWSLREATQASSKKLSGGTGAAFGAEVALNTDAKGQMRECQEGGQRVLLRVFKQQDVDENPSTLAQLEFWQRFQDLCNSQENAFYDAFAQVVDDNGADAGRTNNPAKQAVFAAFLKLVRRSPFQSLIRNARISDFHKGGANCRVFIEPGHAARHEIEHLPETIPVHFLFNNQGPHNHSGNCGQATTSLPSMAACIRFKLIYVPVPSDNKTLRRAMASKDSSDHTPAAKRQKKQDTGKKCDDKPLKDGVIDLTHDIIDLT